MNQIDWNGWAQARGALLAGLSLVGLTLGSATACSVDPQVPEGPFCGGIAGIPCPGSGECVDAPGDGCDPDNGGADCGGICTCSAQEDCAAGMTWDDSPDVCSCVSEPTGCTKDSCPAGSVCVEDADGGSRCVFDPCAGFECPDGQHCTAPADDPYCTPDDMEGEPCGSVVCGEGQVCCNASCSICTPPDGACIQRVCDAEE